MPLKHHGLLIEVCGKCNLGMVTPCTKRKLNCIHGDCDVCNRMTPVRCWVCGGSGVLYAMDSDDNPIDRTEIDKTLASIHCPKCQPHRSEYDGSEDCDLCNGFGTVFRKKEVDDAR